MPLSCKGITDISLPELNNMKFSRTVVKNWLDVTSVYKASQMETVFLLVNHNKFKVSQSSHQNISVSFLKKRF